jgi:hypothetical protein
MIEVRLLKESSCVKLEAGCFRIFEREVSIEILLRLEVLLK